MTLACNTGSTVEVGMAKLPGSSDPIVQWNEQSKEARCKFLDRYKEAKKAHRGTLNPTAFCYAHNPAYLGLRGPFYTGEAYGNDSSNVQATLDTAGYWQRVYYKSEALKANGVGVPSKKDTASPQKQMVHSASAPAIAGTEPNTMQQSRQSFMQKTSSTMRRSGQSAVSGLEGIRKSMHPIVMTAGKPEALKLGFGEGPNFHNSLSHKYGVKSGAGTKTFEYDRQGHRSSKAELTWLLSNQYRADVDCVMNRTQVLNKGVTKTGHF